MDLTLNNILTVFLALFIILCLYNDYIKPFISNLIQGKSLTNAITESFSSQTSSAN